MNKAIEVIRTLDKEHVLETFLDINAFEFATCRDKDCLSDLWVIKNSDVCGLDEETKTQLLMLAREVRENGTLALLYFHCERLTFEFVKIYENSKCDKWPSFDGLMPGRSDLFLLLVALSAVPRIIRKHRTLGISRDITKDTCSDIASRVMISREFKKGQIGISPNCLRWLRNHTQGTLFQFGRLQFHSIIMGGAFRIYKNLTNGDYMMIAEPDMRFNSEGFHDGVGGELSSDAWYSVWDEKTGVVEATPILGNGRARREPVSFRLEEWELVVDQNSTVLNTHIPRGPRIHLSDWRESILRGFDFFENKLGSTSKPAACVCRSWIFEPRLQQILPETSNMIKLQKRLQLFSFLNPGSTRCGFNFIFGDDDIDIENAPRDTSLRRAILDHVQGGGAITGGGMIIMKDEVERRLAD